MSDRDELYQRILRLRAHRLHISPEQAEKIDRAKPLFLSAAEAAAERLGISAEEVLAADLRRMETSSYPTPDCLTPDEIQSLVEARFASEAKSVPLERLMPEARIAHIHSCDGCRTLLNASQPEAWRRQEFRRVVVKELSGVRFSRQGATARLQIPLDARRFATGLTWKDYMAQMGDTRARTEQNYANSRLTDEERKFFSSVTGVKYVMMLAENWCGDVHRNSPLIAHVVEAMPGAELRVFFRDQNPDLRDTFLNNGYQSIPVVVFFDEEWNEIGRWIERAHGATTASVGIRARTLGAVPRGASKEQQDAAMAEFRKQVQAEYDKPGGALWRAAAAEVKLLLEARLRSREEVNWFVQPRVPEYRELEREF